MASSTRPTWRSGLHLTVAVVAVGGLGITISDLRVTRASFDDDAEDRARQVTVFGVLATPDAKTVDSRLATIHTQLNKLLPGSGFKLMDVRSERVIDGESLTCNVGCGYSLTTLLIRSLDENGKVELEVRAVPRTGPRVLDSGQDARQSTILLPACA